MDSYTVWNMGWRAQVAMALVVTIAGLSVGCSAADDDGSGQSQPKEIGAACGADDECDTGICAPAGICTKSCDAHSDCGCAPGTTNGDISYGRCEFGCMESTCTTVCHSNVDCAGETECTSGTSFDACL